MGIEKTINGKEEVLKVCGRIDTTNANDLEVALADAAAFDSVVLDFEELEYISSVGLRILLSTHKKTGGKLLIKHVNDFIMEVFELTGFAAILNIAEE